MSGTTPASVENRAMIDASPYKGLTPYAEEDAPFFFGRDEWSEIIVDNLRAHRLTLLYGDSGVGKTSVLRAGVEHDLRERARGNLERGGTPDLAVAVFSSWRKDPLTALIRCLYDAAADTRGEEPAEPAESLDLEAALEDCAGLVGGKLFVVLDQFEEYFLYCGALAGEGAFAEAFPRAVNRRDLRVSFLVSIREDALAKLDRFKGPIPNLFDNCLRINRLDREEARQAIVRPLAEYNRRAQPDEQVDISAELVETILEEVEAGKVVVGQTGAGVANGAAGSGEAGIETPYLQLVLSRLWSEELRAGSHMLQPKTFERLGGAQGIVQTHLDAAMSALSSSEQEVAARLFHHLVTPSGTKIAQGLQDLVTYAERPEAETASILEKLSGEIRILRPVGSSSYEIYHDALASPILDWRTRREERVKRRRERRRVAVLGVTAICASLVALAFVLLALQSRHQKQLARSRELAANAVSQLLVDPHRSLQLAVKAADVSRTAQAEDALRAALGQSHVRTVLRAHVGPVGSAAFSPDGSLIVTTGSADGTARVWQTAGGRRFATLRTPGFAVDGAAFSRDGTHVVTASSDGSARVWDMKKGGEPIVLRGRCREVGECLPVLDAAFASQGTVVFETSELVFVYRLADASQPLHILQPHGGGGVDRAAVSPDGRLVAIALTDGRAQVWDVVRGKRVKNLRRHDGPILAIAFSPDGKLVVTAGQDGIARVSEAGTGQTVLAAGTLNGHTGPVRSAAFSSDGRLVVTAGDDGSARIWKADSGEAVAVLRGHTAPVHSAAFSPDGKLVVTASDDETAQIWQVATEESLAVLRGHKGSVCCAAFSPGGGLVVTAGSDETARVWKVASLQPVAVLHDHEGGVTDVAFDPEGPDVVTTGSDGTARVFDAKTGRPAYVLRGGAALNSASFSADGKHLVIAGNDGTVGVWDPTSHRQVAVLHAGGRPVRSAVFGGDGRLVVTASARQVRVWEWASGRILAILPAANGDCTKFDFTSAIFSPDDNAVLTADRWTGGCEEASAARVWPLPVLRGSKLGNPSGIKAFQSRHGLGADGVVGPQTLGALNSAVLVGHTGAVNSAAFSPDGKLVATASSDNTARVWQLKETEVLVVLRGHSGPVRSVEFSSDGKLVITASDDGTARVWQAVTGQVLEILRGHTGPVSNAAFSPDGSLVATASADGTTRIYSCQLCGTFEHLLTLARARLGAVG